MTTRSGPGSIAQRLHRLPASINSLKDLREHLQVALELEHSTIPPYLCALYSIREGTNQAAAAILQGIVMEEMLHMAMVSNVLNAIGGHPRINHPGFVPDYPTYLPHSRRSFVVHLQKFSPQAIETCLRIEEPEQRDAVPEVERYHTIGQFYDALEAGLRNCWPRERRYAKSPSNRAKQILPQDFYGAVRAATVGSMGRAPRKLLLPIEVHDLRSALDALEVIVQQGEGVGRTILSGEAEELGVPTDDPGDEQYAHFYRLKEIHEGRRYAESQRRRGAPPGLDPAGEELLIDWTAVYNMQTDPAMTGHPEGGEIRVKLRDFNCTYTTLLDHLHWGFNGQKERLVSAVGLMYDLKYKAVALMRVPSGYGDTSVGPSFEYVLPEKGPRRWKL